MSCILSNGYTLPCKDGHAGIKVCYIGTFDGGQAYQLDADDQIIGLTGSTASYVSYYTFEQELETAELKETPGYENNNVYYTQNLVLNFYKNSKELRNMFLVLNQAPLSVIIEDHYGDYWLLGAENGLRATAGERSHGKAFSDMNGFTITLTGKESKSYYHITAAGIADFDIT
jgi:hypothetical protein